MPESARHVYHLITAPDWQRALEQGGYRPASLEDEGFVHFSFAAQVAATADRHYRTVPDLLVLEVDPARLPHPLVVEDSYGRGEEFPHLYGEFPLSAVVATHRLDRGDDGAARFSGTDHAAGDR